MSGLQTIQLGQFTEVKDAAAQARLQKLFSPEDVKGRGAAEPSEAPPVATPAGWTSDQDLIKKVELAAVAAVHSNLTKKGWKRHKDTQTAGCGYDFEYIDASGSLQLVEVKGTTSTGIRFVLTRKEQEVLVRQGNARVHVVTSALAAPVVHPPMDWAAIEGLGAVPDRWWVG